MIDDQLPEDLAALFAAERAAPVAAGGAKALVKAKLAASLAAAPLGASTSLLGVAGKLISVLAIGVGLGAGAIAVSRRGGELVDVPPPPRVEVAAPELSAHVEADRPSAPSIVPPVSLPAEPPARAPRRTAIEQPAPAADDPPVAIPAAPLSPDISPPPSASLAHPSTTSVPPPPQAAAVDSRAAVSESSLLAQAWSSLSARDAARALVLVREGERTYPGGPLSEEREAIRILALSQLHRRDETRAAAAQFLTNYPHSIHRPLVQRALEEAP